MTHDSQHLGHQHRFAARRTAATNARRDAAAAIREPMDRWIERALHTDNYSYSREWKEAVTEDKANGTEQKVWYKQFRNPLSDEQVEALTRALVDYGVIDDVHTPQTPSTYQLAADQEGKIWQVRIPEERFAKMTLARAVYKGLRAEGWEKQEYKHPTNMVPRLAYSKNFNEPLVNADKESTEAGKAVETALQRVGLERGTHYDWNDAHPTQLEMPEASYQRFMAAFSSKSEAHAR